MSGRSKKLSKRAAEALSAEDSKVATAIATKMKKARQKRKREKITQELEDAAAAAAASKVIEQQDEDDPMIESDNERDGSGNDDDIQSNGEEETNSILPNNKKKPKGEHTPSVVRCNFCMKITTGIQFGFCDHPLCQLRQDIPFDSPQNVTIRIDIVRGQSNTTQTPAPRVELTARDKEFERQALAGAPYPRFEDVDPMSVADANTAMLGAYNSADYAMASASLRMLIQCGKLVNVGEALPIRTDAVGSAAPASVTIDTGTGLARLSTTAKGAVLTSLTDFMRALIGTIIPSLIQQPKAVIDWCTMSMTVMELANSQGWDTANQYLSKSLARSVEQRVPFGAQNPAILQDILIKKVAASRGNNQQQSNTANTNNRRNEPKRRDGEASSTDDVCQEWNFRNCTVTGCTLRHQCYYIGTKCPDPDTLHRARDCAGHKHRGQKNFHNNHNNNNNNNNNSNNNSNNSARPSRAVVLAKDASIKKE